MESLTSHKSRWLRKTTAAGMIPLLLAQASIALFCSLSHEGNQRGRDSYLLNSRLAAPDTPLGLFFLPGEPLPAKKSHPSMASLEKP